MIAPAGWWCWPDPEAEDFKTVVPAGFDHPDRPPFTGQFILKFFGQDFHSVVGFWLPANSTGERDDKELCGLTRL